MKTWIIELGKGCESIVFKFDDGVEAMEHVLSTLDNVLEPEKITLNVSVEEE